MSLTLRNQRFIGFQFILNILICQVKCLFFLCSHVCSLHKFRHLKSELPVEKCIFIIKECLNRIFLLGVVSIEAGFIRVNG